MRLARVGPVWLTRRFWSLIDGAYFYRSYPEELAPDRGNSAAATVEALVLWHTAWLHGALDGLFFWIGDARRESALPTNWSSDVISRYERLCAAFPVVNGGETAAPPVEPLTACGQEAFALAAALTTDAPIILTASQQHGQPPLICTEAAAIAHIDVHGPTEWTSDVQLGRPHRAPKDQTAGRSIGISRHRYRCGAHTCARCDVTAAVPAGRRHG